MAGAERRVRLIARDLVEHFERRLEATDGKGMIVGMSRRICVELYREIVALRPDWHDPDDAKRVLKVVLTSSAADPAAWQPHVRSKGKREALAKRFRDANDPFRLVIVRDMWLTGFDAPGPAHDVRRQADARSRAHAGYRPGQPRVPRQAGRAGRRLSRLGRPAEAGARRIHQSGAYGQVNFDQDAAVAALRKHHEICCGLFYGFERSAWSSPVPADRLSLLPAAQQHVLAQEKGKSHCLKAVSDLSNAFALVMAHEAALALTAKRIWARHRGSLPWWRTYERLRDEAARPTRERFPPLSSRESGSLHKGCSALEWAPRAGQSSGCSFDRRPGVLLLELHRAEIAERGV